MAADDTELMVVIKDPDTSGHLIRSLVGSGFEPRYVPSGERALAYVSQHERTVVFAADDLPDLSLLDLIRSMKRLSSMTVIITVTHAKTDVIMRQHIDAGAIDVLMADASPQRINQLTSMALKWRPAPPAPSDTPYPWGLTVLANPDPPSAPTQGAVSKTGTPPGAIVDRFLGRSDVMQDVYRAIEGAARTVAPVFISGESGTGKELTAQAIHRSSPRADKPFIALNCAAIPRDLMESELFGHVKGAFTGATADREGLQPARKVEPSSWMNWRKCRSISRQSCCASSKPAKCSRSVA